MRTASSTASVRRLASPPPTLACARQASRIWRPTVMTGLSENLGSCMTMAMRRPRTARSVASSARRRSVPAKLRRSALTSPGDGTRRRMARPTVDLPEPDSPTMPSFSRPRVKETPRTASITRAGVG